jgi:type II secretory pathway pseudopilin PulG
VIRWERFRVIANSVAIYHTGNSFCLARLPSFPTKACRLPPNSTPLYSGVFELPPMRYTKTLRSLPVLSRVSGFTLVETVVALAVSVSAMAAFFASAGEAIRVLKIGKETASASRLLQQRTEALRANKLWSNITTVTSFTRLVSNAAAIYPGFPAATETYTVSAYPPDGTSFTVTRNAGGTISTSGAPLPASQRCVKIRAQISWTGVGKLSRNRTQATLLAKGGI